MKKFTAILLSLLMLLVPLTVMAEEITDPDFVLEIQSVNAELVAGDTVSVDVSASANKGYAYASAKFEWNSEALELTGVEFTDAAPNNKSSVIKSGGAYTVRFGNNLAEQNFTETGKFFTLVFRIVDTDAAGSYDIKITELSVFDASDNARESYSFAGKVNIAPFADAGIVLIAESAEGKYSDSEIRIPVSAMKNDGYKTASVFVSWNASAFELSKVEYTSAAPDGGSAEGESAGSYLVKIGKATASSDYTETGVFFTLVFKPTDTAVGGTYPVTLAAAFATDKDGNKVKTSLASGNIKLTDDRAIEYETVERPTEAPEPTVEPDTTPVEDTDYSGKVGDCAWRFDSASGALTISGSGAMADFGEAGAQPYAKYADAIKTVTIASGVTEIGDRCFAGLTAAEKITIPSTVTRIGNSAFEDCSLSEITVPSSVTEIGEYAIGYKTNGVDGEGEAVHEKTAVTIKGEVGSAAEAYAEENSIGFETSVCSHSTMDEQIVRPDITKNTDGYQKVVCSKCGEVMANVSLGCPVIKLSKTKYTYSGKTFKPAVNVIYDGELLPAKGSDGTVFYTVKYLNNKNAGTAKVTVTMSGAVAAGSKTLKFTIAKDKNPMKVSTSAKTVKIKTLKSKKVNITKAITVKKNQGAVSYKKVAKGSSKNLSISSKGVITVKKGKYKKSTQKIVVEVTAKGNSNYEKLTAKVTVKINLK